MVAILVHRLLVIAIPGPLTPHRGLIDPQVVISESRACELSQSRMYAQVVQRWAPRLRETPHAVELRRTKLPALRRTITYAGATVVIGESVGGEQVLEVVRYRVDLAFGDEPIDKGPAFGTPLLGCGKELGRHGVNGRRG